MGLVPLTQESEISNAFAVLCQTLNQDCRTLRRKVGWQGGGGEYDLQWNSSHGFWTVQEQFSVENRHILLLGTQNPEDVRSVGIVCEVNPPKRRVDRKCAGVFLKEGSDVFLAHRGKIGGGRAGIGRAMMRQHYSAGWQHFVWPDRKTDEAIVLGKIDSPLLSAHLAAFVREVERIKEQPVQSISTNGSASPPEPALPFAPEFAGRRSGYRVSSQIEADCEHGYIINSLAEELRRRNLRFNRDVRRDLFLYGRDGTVKLLFEAKPEITTSTIYQGIGQLFFHSACQQPRPSLVFVLPEPLSSAMRDVFHRLGIHVLSFVWVNDRPAFTNLSGILQLAD